MFAEALEQIRAFIAAHPTPTPTVQLCADDLVKGLSERLGHAHTAFTMQTYRRRPS